MLIILQKKTKLLIILLKKQKETKLMIILQKELKKTKLLIILQKKQKKTLPYWKDWKKTERNFLSKSETSWRSKSRRSSKNTIS